MTVPSKGSCYSKPGCSDKEEGKNNQIPTCKSNNRWSSNNIRHNNSCITRQDRKRDSPSAPSPGLVLFNSEEEADIIFNVAVDYPKDVWRIPAHSFILSGSSPVFRSLVNLPMDKTSTKQEINVFCQPELFYSMLR